MAVSVKRCSTNNNGYDKTQGKEKEKERGHSISWYLIPILYIYTIILVGPFFFRGKEKGKEHSVDTYPSYIYIILLDPFLSEKIVTLNIDLILHSYIFQFPFFPTPRPRAVYSAKVFVYAVIFNQSMVFLDKTKKHIRCRFHWKYFFYSLITHMLCICMAVCLGLQLINLTRNSIFWI